LRIRLRTADGCLRMVMVGWDRPKPFYVTMLCGSLPRLDELPLTIPYRERRYQLDRQLGPQFYEYREVLNAN
jgi:hypothetical protein